MMYDEGVLKPAWVQPSMLQHIESSVNRLCAQLVLTNEDQCNLNTLSFTFMVWDHTARGVRMGCVRGKEDDSMVFIVSYDSPANGRRLFMGAPWVVDPLHHEQGRVLASEGVVNQFLRDVCAGCLQAEVVFDGSLAVDKPVALHLKFDHLLEGKALLIKDVAECENILLVIDMFQ